MDTRIEPLEPDCFYHVYNEGINGCKIFYNEENYYFFLRQFAKYAIEICDVYAYCLMPNHFHFVLKIKNKEHISIFANEKLEIKPDLEDGLHCHSNIASKQFGKLLSSYSQAFNKVYQRHGPLLESPFKRKKIDSENYLKNLILYIHQNPTDLNKDFKNYKHSSYQSILSKSKTKLMRNEVIKLFSDVDNFIHCHNGEIQFEF